MRVAVVGASGFVGATLVERLLGRPLEIRALIHTAGGAWRLSRHGIPLHAFDALAPRETARALEGCTHVVDCSRGTRALMFEGLQNLLDACRALGVARFIHVSSVEVYGHPPRPESAHEEAPAEAAKGTHGWDKLRQDEMVQAACLRGLPSVILCPPYLTGRYSRFLLRLVRAIAEGRFALVDGGAAPCNVVDVHNLAQAVELALTNGPADGSRLFVTHDEPVSWRELVDAVAPLAGSITVPAMSAAEAERLGRSAPRFVGHATRMLPTALRTRLAGLIRRTPAPASARPAWDRELCAIQLRPVRHVGDKARAALGYRPETTFRDSMRSFRAWYAGTRGWGADWAPLLRALEASAPTTEE